jgi:malate dehydrogenase (oxaloacetate-decarboxylating)
MSNAEIRSAEIAQRALDGHRRWRGKIQTMSKCPVRGHEDFARWYTPGVAAVASTVADDPRLSFEPSTVPLSRPV